MNQIDWNRVLYNEKEKKLFLINQNFTRIPYTLVNLYCDKIQHLDLSFNYLRELDCLQLFINLETIILDNNDIKDEVFLRYNIDGAILPKVKTLSLNKNQINNLSLILFIIARIFPNLDHLSLLGNPACPDGLTQNKSNDLTYESYREQVIQTLPQLKFLDHMRTYKPFIGSIPSRNTRILKFSPKMIFAKLKTISEEKSYSPLPETRRIPGDHCGSYGIKKYKYIGNKSEGNRFILNSDL